MDKMNELDAWEQEERTVTLTNGEWCELRSYITMTSSERANRRAEQMRRRNINEMVTTASYLRYIIEVEFWANMDATLERIKRKIDDALSDKGSIYFK